MIKIRYFLLLAVFIVFKATAAEPLIATDKATFGLSTAITTLKTQGIQTVVLPTVVPAPTANAHYFIYAELKPNQVGYVLSFDNTEKCQGAHYCNAGSLSTETQGNPLIYFDNQNQEITEKIIMKKGHAVYYTPSHAMGDFWPGRVEWRCGPTLYTLSWALPTADEKAALLKMVNSMWDKTQC